MKKWINKGLALLCTLVLLSGLGLPGALAADAGGCGESLSWSLQDGTLTITGSGAMTDYSDYSFAPWYEQREAIHTVILPEGLTRVGNLAFYECSNLTTVALPASVSAIGDFAFAGCTGLLTVTLPGALTAIGESGFRECESLTAVSLPASITTIGDRAFYRCNSLTSITIPGSVTSLGKQAFSYCESLRQAVVNANLDMLPDWSFYGCGNLSSITLAPTIREVGDLAFDGCPGVSHVYTPNGDETTMDEIQQQLPETTVIPNNPPQSTEVTQEQEDAWVTTQVTETQETVIVVDTVQPKEEGETTVNISATVREPSGWQELEKVILEKAEAFPEETIWVSVQLSGTQVSGDDLAPYAGKNICFSITTATGNTWEIDMAHQAMENASQTGDMSFSVTQVLEKPEGISCESLYLLTFQGSTRFNATIPVKLSNQFFGKTATLYWQDGKNYQIAQTVLVDQKGTAWFSLAGTDMQTQYYVAINAEGVNREDAVIPQSMYQSYGAQEGEVQLMDAQGTKYAITGRSSSWGITGKQFALYVAVGIGVVVLLAGSVMYTLYKLQQSKHRYRVAPGSRGETFSPIDQEELRIQVMQELLEEQKNKEKKK